MSEKTPNKPIVKKLVLVAVIATFGAMVLSFGLMALLINIFERQQEAEQPFFRVVEITDETEDPAVWGKNFPMQYDSYQRTVDMVRTRHGGSDAFPQTPTEADPRTIVAQQKLEADPRLVRMWAGYAFAVDFREERGHAYMLDDQTFTLRQQAVQQPGACLHCHASVYTTYKELGDGDIMAGFHEVNKLKYQEARKFVEHPVSCIDCHDPDTMALRITRPAFMEGIAKVKKQEEGIEDYKVNEQATRQEMRSFVCAQCHVEYYFAGAEKTLTFPWDKGLRADDILEYYEEIGFHDWIHAETGAKALKAQHPEFETWRQGIHGRNGVSCADCHMPYERVGAMKVSDHHVRSPLLNINAACQTCHKVPEEELLHRAETIQARHLEMRDTAMDALVDLIDQIVEARGAGMDDQALEQALQFQRKAQFLVDFMEAENSMGFHADQESARVLAKSIDLSRKGSLSIMAAWRDRQVTDTTSQSQTPAFREWATQLAANPE